MPGRVLIISYYWPPTGGSGVQRWVKFSKYLPAEGWQPVIYTPSNPEMITVDESLAAEVPAEVEVIRRKIFEPYGIWRALSGNKGGSTKGEVNPINAGKKSFKQKLSIFIRGNFFIPDPRCLWVRPSVRFLKKYLKEHPVDAIVSTGPPHSMHLIARKLSLATGIPWVADFRDPWTRMFYFKHLGLTGRSERRHHKLEKQVLDDASVIVAVSPPVQRDFQSMTDTPVRLITNGYDESDYESCPEEATDGYFRISHTGLFAADGIPETLWLVLADKSEADEDFSNALRICLAGKTDSAVIHSIRMAGLGEKLVDRGYQPHLEAVREQKRANILMLPLRMEPEYKSVLPGKLFEYLAARRPVLGIGQSNGAMAAILKECKAGTACDWDDYGGIKKFVDAAWDEFREGRDDFKGEDISRFSRRRLSHEMASLLDSISQKGADKPISDKKAKKNER